MTTQAPPKSLHLQHAAQQGVTLCGLDLLQNFERLTQSAQGPVADISLNWEIQPELRTGTLGQSVVWLRLLVQTHVPMQCQRCLETVNVSIEVDRWYRFVASEAQALAEDDACEEDLLVLTRTLDVAALVEDEVLMSLPLVPRHEVCPHAPTLQVADPDFDAVGEQPKPFAALAQLKPPAAD
jgi:uncharacterized protein